MTQNWDIKHKKEVKDLKELVSVLLKNRGIKNKKAFLNPPKPSSYSLKELGIKDISLSIKRINEAILSKEEIVVYGDYDADGICATAILWRALFKLGAKATPFIPDRFEDGYGINPKSVEKIRKMFPNASLIITVDNGIVAFDGVKVANKLGFKVIVSDHHAARKNLPDAYSIIHTTNTSGAGLAWVLASQLSGTDSDSELAAIGVIADQLPLVGFNRAVTKYGINNLNHTQNIGLKKILVTAGLIGKKIGTYEINYAIAPRINATGRMASGMDALRLLCTTNRERAQKLAILLNNLNSQRQETVTEALKLTEKTIEISPGVITLAHKDYHEGVIGLIASKLVEKYYQPAIVFSIQKNIVKASARSVLGFNIIEAIRAAEEFIIEGGGHEGAAGFTISETNITPFIQKIQEVSIPLLTREVLSRKLRIDCPIDFSLLNYELYDKLSAFEPFGVGNPGPTFVSNGVSISRVREVGSSGQHKKLLLQKEGNKIEAILFNYEQSLAPGNYDVVYKLSMNEWNGKKSLELKISDLKNNDRRRNIQK